ncbi:MAG: hypothetical protein HYX67_14960 [Candidatus Melainabacteria bacterium]|nr:hypothetical protein [Candidatus Melainabacteria bacterium]
MSSHEKTEAQIAKAAHHSNDSSNAFHKEYFDSTRNGNSSAIRHDGGAAAHESNTLNLPKLFLDGTNALKQELNREGKQIWDGLDNNPTTHFIKHDYCHDEPVKVGIALAGIATVAAIAAVAAAPEIAAAGAVYEVGTVAAAVSGTANVLLGIDYQNRHPVKW